MSNIMKILKFYNLRYIWYSVKDYHKNNWLYTSWEEIGKYGIDVARRKRIKRNYGMIGIILFKIQGLLNNV